MKGFSHFSHDRFLINKEKLTRPGFEPTNVHGFPSWGSGYGIAHYIMAPYSNPATPSQRNFNGLLARNRVVIKHSFGQMKRRFPILRYDNSNAFWHISLYNHPIFKCAAHPQIA